MRALALLAALVVVAALALYFTPREPHISAGAAERELAAEYVAQARSVDCHRDSNDGSIPVDDLDYTCTVTYRDGETLRWWVGSDSHHITEIDSEGP